MVEGMKNQVELTTDRLRLRPFTMDDIENVLEYANDPEWVRYQVNVPHPYTRNDTITFLTMFLNPEKWGILNIFAIESNGKVIGEIYLNQKDEDRKNQRAELGYSLSRPILGPGNDV